MINLAPRASSPSTPSGGDGDRYDSMGSGPGGAPSPAPFFDPSDDILGPPPLVNRARATSRDGLGDAPPSGNRNRARTNSNSSNFSSNANNPGGSADTRRRITKLSKVRERETAPRLVEYFCVVSSVAVSGNEEEPPPLPNGSPYREPMTSPGRGRRVTRIEATKHNDDNDDDGNGNDGNGTGTEKSTKVAKLDGSEFAPEVTARYPLADHEGNPLLEESVTAFCFPSGKIPIIAATDGGGGGGGGANRMPKVHYFVTTGESGQKMYGTCLTVWEEHEVTVEEKKKNKKKGGKGTWSPGRKNLSSALPKKVSVNDSPGSTSTSTQAVYLPKCLVILSVHPYLVAFREYLTQLHRQSKMVPPPDASAEAGSVVTTPTASGRALRQVLTLPVERYITNFCSELPAPPPGSFQVQTTILDSTISVWSPPHNVPVAWVSLPFGHLFQCLDVENVLKVWTALALERQVLVTSTQLSLLTTCCEVLLSLLFPMKWSHAYIPVLPHFLVPILSAPMPFLCGIDKRHLADAMEDLADECTVVDLDKNMVSAGVKTAAVPRLPRHIYQRLRNKLERNAGHVHREVRSLRSTDDTSEMGIHLPPDVKSMADAMWESRLCLFDEAFMLTFTPEERRKNWLNGDDGGSGSNDPKANLLMTLSEKKDLRGQSQWDAVQEAFLETYCFLLQKYRRFLVFPSKQNEGAYGGAGFRSQEFLTSCRGDVRGFLEELVGSQMFDDFVTKRLYGSGEADISFFDAAVDRYARNHGLVANVRGMVMENGGTGKGDGRGTPGRRGMALRKMLRKGRGAGRPPANSNGEKDPPLLQSARVKRELKTIVPPEPSYADLPDEGVENAVVVHVTAKTRDEAPVLPKDDDDDHTVTSITSASTAASKLDGQVYYHYPTFPERLDPKLFGTPRPMSSAVLAEYDRQREKVGKFRRTGSAEAEAAESDKIARSSAISGGDGPVEKPATSEVTTFTVFFMTFAALVGKDLMAVDGDSLDRLDRKDIVSDLPKEDDGARHIANLVDEIVMDADLPQTPTKKDRPLSGKKAPQRSPVRRRFNDKMSTLKIMEARETARAELVIAFEMLKMMKERGLRADPEAYQCLIDACGRCGDTARATQLLSRMHEDGIVADGVVYSSLVSAFSADNAWKQASGEAREELPDWANGASIDMDWNALKVQKRSYLDIAREKLGAAEGGGADRLVERGMRRIVSWRRGDKAERSKEASGPTSYAEQFVTDHVLRQILLGENLLEIVYPDISIDTDNEFCPRCNYFLSDDDVVAGWTAGNSQEYKTECPNCLTKFVPHFCVQSTLPSFVGSRGPSSALFCERLSPWVLQKELRSVVSGGIEDLLSPEWRERESKNAVLWWNLILSFMRYRLPFTFLLQGSFSSSLIAPTPDDEENLDTPI